MPITLTPITDGSLCGGSVWSIADESLLAHRIAAVALGQSRHVAKILAGTAVAVPMAPAEQMDGAIADSDFDIVRKTVRAAKNRCGQIYVHDRVENNIAVHITVGQATSLLNRCIIDEVALVRMNYHVPSAYIGGYEGRPTGILLTYKEDPLIIYVKGDLRATIDRIAREAKATYCPGLKIWNS